ncbi:hypothetical protein GGX14DRAFT_479101 [Mycena pura]|uniref:Uncharacterized protein n=1 Tax=Mycena pura TaxID=153505 RepID=A0AAD6UT70_9AGAR|nr:hypothetical protein GGX14DRAFT_479101 [Mycena pura]
MTEKRAPSSMALAAVAVLLCASASLNVLAARRLREAISAPDYAALDFPLSSELPLAVTPAVMQFRFAQHYNITVAEEWATLIPPRRGHVRLLRGDAEAEPVEYGVGMYADLACLDTIRASFVRMRDHGVEEANPESEACFGHIRQAIMCTADVTLEAARVECHEEDGKTVCPPDSAVLTGERVDHRCRDWTQVREFVEKNQAGALWLD